MPTRLPLCRRQDRLIELKEKHRDVMRDVLLDVLRALASPNSDIRRKTLDLALDLLDTRCAAPGGLPALAHAGGPGSSAKRRRGPLS